VLPLFDLGSGVAPTSAGQLVTPARICYFDDDGVRVEAEVNDLGALLQRLRPGDVDEWSNFMAHVAPVTILSRSVVAPSSGGSGRQRPVWITLSLLTDLWFPWVLGTIEGEQPLNPLPRLLYDNRHLASCHTPRLNRFLTAVCRLAVDLGGEWSRRPPEGSAQHYSQMVGEAEILLDVTPVGYTLREPT